MRPSRSLRRVGRCALSLSRPPALTPARSPSRSLSPVPSRYLVPPLFPARLPLFFALVLLAPSRVTTLYRARSLSASLSLSRCSSRARPCSPRVSPLSSVSPAMFSAHLTSSRLALSRVVVSLSQPLFPARYVTTLSRLARSSSNHPRQASRALACIFAFFSLALCTPLFDGAPLSLSVTRLLSYFSLPLALSPSRSLSPFSPAGVFFLRPTGSLARSLYIARCLVCGTYIMRGCVSCVCERAPWSRPSRAHSVWENGRVCACVCVRARIASIRVAGKKMGGCIVGACHRCV